jgi:hypothetical protein
VVILRTICLKTGNVEKTKYMLLFRHQNAGQIHDTKIVNGFFENVAHLKYFGNDSIKSKFDSGGN